ncbi:uncharacterized protein PGTG_13013 [Puccinia graminis f. sp. tritici CRL 75-36-700-3]|uniref:AB hydrolase-1 domain-containing protein n=1 Tax=Puccinia graminis f. sp. tritici (strain CRL 75-36-700-3 / race SCCL) TaxID=418459 RepID=E3KQQ6_PUCGT|nr:uncharacterized protein PGTG_13013 [Puccinia graminis f. sp. tritici CRL 75-36-700-3]EFP86631.1 hypothetical protein PGTG_13013 [Puccinia graminis f. sp. tritici CRL 75-36-700-3]
MTRSGNDIGSDDSKDNQSTASRDTIRKLLTSYRYPGYPPSDLSIHSSFEQPHLTFDRSTNRFSCNPSDGAHFQPLNSPSDSAAKPPITGPRILVYMIPGNPGLVEFYDRFLSVLCSSFDAIGGCEAVCCGHLGHSLRHNSNLDLRFLDNFKLWNHLFDSSSSSDPTPNHGRQSSREINPPAAGSLADQIEFHCHLVGQILHEGIKDPTHTKLVIMGHSVGGYIATKVLERYPDQVMHIIGLFPTLSHIGRSPNGLRLRPLFSPILLPFLNILQIVFCLTLPKMIICRLITLYYSPISGTRNDHQPVNKNQLMKAKDLSEQNLLIILNFILNINSVTAVLKMARSEMKSICELDRQFIHRFNRQMTLFWASHQADEWVGETEITEIIDLLNLYSEPTHDTPSEENHSRLRPTHQPSDLEAPTSIDNQPPPTFEDMVIENQSHVSPTEKVPVWKRMKEGIPHAFCLKDNEVMAKECSALIKQRLSN